MTERIPTFFLLLTLCGPVLLADAQEPSAGGVRPNVLLITSEDNGPQLGCYGDPYVKTPNLDRLADEGVRFGRAFVTTASCSESRAAILTGLYGHQSGQIGLATHRYRMFGPLPNAASLLKRRGYRTGLIGKLHVNPESAFPFDFRPKVGKCNTFARRDVARVAELAAGFFKAADSPFFLMVNYADAHLPFLRQQHGLPKVPLTANDVRPLPWIGLDTPSLRQSQADYYNCIMRLDTGVGMLLAALADAGLAGNTLVIYLGDHGAQFPRGKLASYESSLHVPLIVRFPGQIPAGQTRPELISTVDLLPTILQATRTAPPPNLAGRSLLPLLSKTDKSWREYLFSEYHGHYPPLYFPQRTVRDQRYKLIVNLLQDRPNPSPRLVRPRVIHRTSAPTSSKRPTPLFRPHTRPGEQRRPSSFTTCLSILTKCATGQTIRNAQRSKHAYSTPCIAGSVIRRTRLSIPTCWPN